MSVSSKPGEGGEVLGTAMLVHNPEVVRVSGLPSRLGPTEGRLAGRWGRHTLPADTTNTSSGVGESRDDELRMEREE